MTSQSRKLVGLCALAAAASLASASVASADTTLGSTAIPSGSGPSSCSQDVIAQPTNDPSTPFTVPSLGRITEWRVNTSASNPGTPITFVVLRSLGGDAFSVVGADPKSLPNPLPADNIASFIPSPPIAVNGGEILALHSTDNGVTCYYSGGTTPAANTLISLDSATSPSPGQTLVTDDTSGPGFRLNLAATLGPPSPPVTPKKKCKKKGKAKKHSASEAKKKKKKCKKRKKKGQKKG